MSAGRLTVWAAAILAGAYALTGIVVVSQDEVGVVRRFGAVQEGAAYSPGMHWGWPWGMDRVDRVALERARTISVGAGGTALAPLSRAPAPDDDDFLTGDLNLATVSAQIQFRVVRPVDYLFRAASPDAALAALARSALVRALAGRGIDDVLTGGRAEVAERLRSDVQAGADREGLGVSIRTVRLARVAPPVPVAPAFADAARARSDQRQAVTRAEEYRDRAIADARGLSREIHDRATASADLVVQKARGEADRFTQLLAEARKDPAAIRQRLYLEALATLLPRFSRKVVVAPGQDLDLSLFEESGGAARPSKSASASPEGK
jgi:membrane protease subunit HflK